MPRISHSSQMSGIYPFVGEVSATRHATFVVAASNASLGAKQQADWVCSGAADNVDIQEALDSLPAISGGHEGTVQLSEGTFYLAAGIVIKGDVHLKGAGNGQSFLEQMAGVNLSKLIYADATIHYHVVLEGFTLVGSKATNPTAGCGIDVTRLPSCLLRDLGITGCKTYGIFGQTGGSAEADGIRLTNVSVASCDSHGIYVLSAAGWLLSQASSDGNGGWGLRIEGGGECYAFGLTVDSNASGGIALVGAYRVSLTSFWVGANTGKGVDIYQSTRCLLNGGTIHNNDSDGLAIRGDDADSTGHCVGQCAITNNGGWGLLWGSAHAKSCRVTTCSFDSNASGAADTTVVDARDNQIANCSGV